MIKPNWKNSILNVSATFQNFLGGQNDIYKLKEIEKVLNKNYKNVVYICFDGLGMFPLKQNLNKNTILRKSIVKTITSVFPSTTTNATTTLCSATYPSNHGLLGWSLYFEEINKCVDIYLNKDSYTGDSIESSDVNNYLKFKNYFDIENSKYKISTVFPPYVKGDKNNYIYNNIDELFKNIKTICNNNTNNFIYAYCCEPDSTMHSYGVTSKEANILINLINNYVQDLADSLSDTVIIITPDHGQTDIKEYIKLYEDKELLDSLKTPLYLEARAVAFQVKDESKFLKAIKKYKKDAKLFKVSSLIKKNFFGPESEKLKMLGDYILVMKNNYKQFVLGKNKTLFKGHHTALTRREMILPLIVIEKE